MIIHSSPLSPISIPESPLCDYVLERAIALDEVTALIDGTTGHTINYGELDQQVRSFAGGLVARGFSPGDVVAILSPNVPDYAVVFLGTVMAGGVVTTINPAYTPREINFQLVDANAKLLITVDALIESATEACANSKVEQIVTIGSTPYRALFADSLESAVPRDPDDLAVLPYSSGTTGVNKGVMLSNRNLVANITQTVAGMQLHEGDVIIAVLPFFHIYGMQVLMNSGLRSGATIVTMPKFDLEQFLSLHQKHRVTRTFVAPPIVVALAKHPLVDQFDLSSIDQIFSGAAPLSAELAIAAGERIGCEVVQGYGMTELSPVSHLTPPNGFKPGSAGVTVASTETRVVDPESGEDQPVDKDGEIWVKGPQVMLGYLNNPAATAATIDQDGWLHTGDIGHIDGDGHLFIVDRLKELIKVKGFQVAPAELEAILLSNPAIADAAVIGRPDESAGEVPVAFVVLKTGEHPSADDLANFVSDHVAHYKQIKDFIFVDAVPKSASGKILRRLLRDQIEPKA